MCESAGASKYLNELRASLKIASYRGNDSNELPKKLSKIRVVLLKNLKDVRDRSAIMV